jgi:hypothetical protein
MLTIIRTKIVASSCHNILSSQKMRIEPKLSQLSLLYLDQKIVVKRGTDIVFKRHSERLKNALPASNIILHNLLINSHRTQK